MNKQKKQHFESLFRTLTERGHFNGAVLVAEQGTVIYEGAFGYADIESGRKLTKNSVFELASVSKPITALGIVLLAQEGKLAYDDEVVRWIPELPYPGVTIRQLLHHTSGLPDYESLFMEHWDEGEIANNADVLKLLAEHQSPVKFAPNEKWEYSNTGYVLLAVIAERVSGLNFSAFMNKHLFEPLGMADTRVYNRRYSGEIIEDYAYGYVWDPKEQRFALPDSIPGTSYVIDLDGIQGDGTVNTTIGDLLKLDQALYTETLFTKQSLEEAFTPVRFNNGGTYNYGYGWFLNDDSNRGKMVGHGGNWPGYVTDYKRFIDKQKTLILLLNMEFDHAYIHQIEEAVGKILFDEPFEIPEMPPRRKPISLAPEVYDPYIGCYLLDGDEVETELEEGRFMLGDQVELHPISETRFFMNSEWIEVEFVELADGKANAFILYGGEEPKRAERVD